MGGRSSMKQVDTGKSRPRKRGVGERVFAEVEQLTAGGAMKRTAAIAQVAARLGSNPGTVAANYYRIARQRGVALRPRRRRGVANGRRGFTSATLTAAIRTIESALRSQAEELAALRRDNERFEELRRLLRT
jgi:hypothetical protein